MGRDRDQNDNNADLDDLVGFATPASLGGVKRSSSLEDSAPPSPLDTNVIRFGQVRADETIEPDNEASESRLGSSAWARQALPVEPEPTPLSDQRIEPASVDGAARLYLTYGLILMAPPTGGVSALIALLALWGRAPSSDPVTRSHEVYQKRTLFMLLIAAVIGAILVVVNLGVFVLFVLILWVLARGVSGLMTLKAGKAVRRPRTFWI